MRLIEMTPLLPVRLIEHPGHPDQKVHGRKGSGGLEQSLKDLDSASSVPRGYEPTWESERHGLARRGAPGTAPPGTTHINRYDMPGAGNALSVVIYGDSGAPVGAFSGLLPGSTQQVGAFKVSVDPAFSRQGIGLKLLDAADGAGFNVAAHVGVNSYTPSGRALVRKWLTSRRFNEARLLEHPGGAGHKQKSHGRKGEGAAPNLDKQLAELDAGLRTVRGAERLVAIDPGTGKVVLDKGQGGTAVELTQADDVALAGTVATHNHPIGWESPEGSVGRNGSAFSPDDLMTASRTGVAEMRVVAPGSTYTMRNASDQKWGQVTADDAAGNTGEARILDQNRTVQIMEVNRRVETAMWGEISKGTLTPVQAQAIHHEVLGHATAAKFGWEFTVERTPSYVDPGVKATDFVTPELGQGTAWLNEANLVERIATEVVRLLEHPGHSNQKTHGRRGSIDVSGIQHGNLSDATKAKIQARMEKEGLPSIEQMAANLQADFEAASPEAMEGGMNWYEDTHKQAAAMGERDGFSLDQEAAIIAHMSSQRSWESNMPAAIEISRVIGGDKPFSVDAERGSSARPPVKGGTYKPSDLNPGQVAWTHPDLSTRAIADKYGISAAMGKAHYKQLGTSIEVLRGTKTPSEILGGPKTRSFQNNIYDPNGPSVTVDDWAYKSALGGTVVKMGSYTGPANKAEYGQLGQWATTSPSVKSENYRAGIYPAVAQSFATAAKNLGIKPQQLQAVVWVQARFDAGKK